MPVVTARAVGVTVGCVAAGTALVICVRRRVQRRALHGDAAFLHTLHNLTPTASPDVGWIGRELSPPRGDVTADFLREMERIRDNIHSPLLDAQYVYAFVPGFLSSYSPFGYFTQAIKRLRGLGLSVHFLGVDSSTDGECARNAARLRLALGNLHRGSGGKKLVVIAHSKGFLDVGLALVRYPELADMVQAVVCLQAPYGGAALADDIYGDEDSSRVMVERVLERFDLGLDALRDMSFSARRAVIQDYGDVHATHPAMRLVCLASEGPASFASPMALLNMYLYQRHGAVSDGLVCTRDSLIPGSLVILLKDVDHGTPVLPGLPGADVRGDDLVEAAVVVALTPDAQLEIQKWDPPGWLFGTSAAGSQ